MTGSLTLTVASRTVPPSLSADAAAAYSRALAINPDFPDAHVNLGTLLFGVTPFDLASYGAATGILAAAVLVAAWWPAYRAGRVSPLVALTGKS